jgi:hypothetical protein
LFAANAIAAAGLGAAALALSPSAAADPVAPPVIPPVPALSMLQQFATNPASMGAVLQSAATALSGASNLVGAPAPSTLPVSPIQGAPGVPVYPAAPAGLAPVSSAPDTGVVPLLSQFGIPAQLANLAPPEILPSMLGNTLGIAQPAAAAPVAPRTAPLAVAPVSPGAAGINPLPLLTALP